MLFAGPVRVDDIPGLVKSKDSSPSSLMGLKFGAVLLTFWFRFNKAFKDWFKTAGTKDGTVSFIDVKALLE